MPRQTRARIDLNALRGNFRLARELAPGTHSMAVVKADGYGHGLEAVAQALTQETDCLAVATLEEAQRIRQVGLSPEVVLLEGVHEPSDWRLVVEGRFQPVLHSLHQLEGVDCVPGNGAVPVWVKCNTGMNRLGLDAEGVETMVLRIRETPGLEVAGLMTHYACADDTADAMTGEQARRMRAISREFPGLPVSAANSAAHFHGNESHFDWTRPGIMLYGGTPLIGRRGPDLDLRPVMKLESRVIAVRTLAPGETVGYGATWTAEQPTRMGIVEIGYGDGYPRHAPNGTPVAVDGCRCELIGRVSMDMIAVSLEACPQAGVGSSVELWGETVSVDEVAQLSGTISYELLTAVSPRVPRLHESGEEA
ncbi:alanine racemase [Halospina denitrificans]|uniref:Alanine racemase n=1 Tax=Halospina denitrificans TaxID=332522 RepID=A0A4R7JL43_9GAMM|nr:alanine racemase [Halospina denitrificans]TDT37817.1 alanine racemase [Halospina denitrificans]